MGRIIDNVDHFFTNLRMKWKFWLLIFSLSFISCMVIFVYALLVFRNYDETLYRNASQLLYMSIDNIESDLIRVEKNSDEIVVNPLVQSALRKQTFNAVMDAEPNARKKEPTLAYNIAASNIFNALSGALNDNSYIMTVSLYFEDQHIYAGYKREDMRGDWLPEAMEAARAANGRPVWLPSGLNDYSVICVREIKGIQPFTLESLGVLVIRVDLSGIVKRHLQDSPNFSFMPRLEVSASDKLIYSDLQMPLSGERRLGSGYQVVALEGGRQFLTYTDKSQFNWRYALMTPFDNVIGSLMQLKWIALTLGLLMIVLSMMAAARWSSKITRHFDVLVRKMHRFKDGHFHLEKDERYTGRKDEMGIIHQNFHQMAEELRTLVEDNYVKQLLIREARIKALQHQLDPHFLFNVLQSINWEAKASSQATISTMLESLGKLLRYTVDEEAEMVSLQRELEVVRSYVAIQSYRYPDRLQLQLDVPDHLFTVQVPRLAVQNLVENAIKHALEQMTTICVIDVYANESDEAYHLYIEDNGPGIDSEILDKLERKEVKPMGLGIGLRNMQQRIHLLYPPGSDLFLTNTGSGTIVEIRLVKDKREDSDVQGLVG